MGWGSMWGKQLTAGAQVVVRSCTQPSFCALSRTHAFTGFVSRHKAQYTDMHVCKLPRTHTHAQTNWLREGEIASTQLCASDTIHIANLTLSIFPCVVIILCQFQHSVSRTADKQTQRKHCTKNLIFQKKSNEYFKLVQAVLLCSCHRVHLGCLAELVSLDLLERRSAVPISNYIVCACTHTIEWWWFLCVDLYVWCVLPNVPFLPGWGRRSWRPGVSWRAWPCCESRCLHPSPSCLTKPHPFFAVFLSSTLSLIVISYAGVPGW